MHRQQWSRVFFRPALLWPLVAVELIFFAWGVLALSTHPQYNLVRHAMRAARVVPVPDLGLPVEVVSETAIPQLTPDTSDQPDSAEEIGGEQVAWHHQYGDYQVGCRVVTTNEADTGQSLLEITRNGQVLFSISGYRFNDPEDSTSQDDDAPAPLPGTDLTGEGKPCLVVSEFTGGAHCCSIYYILN